MRTKSGWRFAGGLFAGVMLWAGVLGTLGQGVDQVPGIPGEELPSGAEVLTAGPVHEAFAKPVAMEAEEPILAPQQPPGNVQEVPPAERPAGAGIVWVPGYWAWDAQRNDFVWVSGCWRNAPPNTFWTPGHWLQAGNGWEWIAGFWKPISAQPQQEVEYLPAPPAAFDVGAPGSPPQPDQVWVPGCWYWQQGHYVRRNGYWIAQQVGWVWVPTHFAWTPRGYIFVQGHWDHDMDNRGVLFCPTFFPREIRLRAGFVFSPGACVDLGMLRMNLFVYPRYRHYFFGDYYDDSYARIGILPWFKCETVHTWYDPIFVYDRWHFQKTDPHWAANLERGFDRRHSNRDLRPARTFTQLQAQMTRLPANRRPERPLVESVHVYAASQHTPIKFERIESAERQRIAVKAADIHALRDQRGQWEGLGAAHAAVISHAPETKIESRPVAERRSSKRGEPSFVPARPVRATEPEKVVISNPPHAPQQGDSRYIPKQSPAHPEQERGHPDDSKGRSDRDSRRP